MDNYNLNYVDDYLNKSIELLQQSYDDSQIKNNIIEISKVIIQCLQVNGKILIAGNGGSAGDAQHIAGEFLSRMNYDRAPLAAIALTTDTSVITAIGNDYSFDDIFSRQIMALGRRGDVFIAITTSGNSKNILRAVELARTLGIIVVGFTGSGGKKFEQYCDVCLTAPSKSTPLVQQMHMVTAHIICGLVEDALFAK